MRTGMTELELGRSGSICAFSISCIAFLNIVQILVRPAEHLLKLLCETYEKKSTTGSVSEFQAHEALLFDSNQGTIAISVHSPSGPLFQTFLWLGEDLRSHL